MSLLKTIARIRVPAKKDGEVCVLSLMLNDYGKVQDKVLNTKRLYMFIELQYETPKFNDSLSNMMTAFKPKFHGSINFLEAFITQY